MEKSHEIRETLKFYSYLNELKNSIIDEENNYSIDDHIFGSMILATGIDSEFKETNDLAKIYRMLVLTEFVNLYPNYDFCNLKLSRQYKNEIFEATNMNTKNGKLVSKYKMLDFLLTKLIKEKEKKISELELIKEGSTIIASLCSKKPLECEETFKFYYLNFSLKDKVRTGWDSKHWNIKSDRIETISEHVVSTVGLGMILSSEFNYDFDVDKVLKMLVIHETGETIIGDITPFDGITPEEKERIEHEAMKKALGNLKEKDKLLDLLFEFDKKETSEGKCAYYCDKIEADLQSKMYQDKGMHHTLDDQENNVVFKSSKVQQMLEDGARSAFDIWYGWDKTIYEKDDKFPEFIEILRTASVNSLTCFNRVIRERVELDNDEYSYLKQEIVKIIKKLYKDNNINSAYLTNYQDDYYTKGILSITVLLNSTVESLAYVILARKLNEKFVKENKTNIKVEFCCCREDNYSVVAMNPSEVSNVEELVESTILFDKLGEITKIQNTMRKYNHAYSYSLIEYVPPINKELSLKLN